MLPNLQIWRNHFEYHSEHPRHLPEGLPNVLTRDERRVIAASVAIFQLGEQSPGTHLLRAAYRFAQEHPAAEVARIAELLILEEQQHARLLHAFMVQHGIPPRQRHWTDSLFRRIRRLAGLEFSLSILVTAELIGIVYYRALERATECQRLRLLCRMLVADELAHVGFESDLLLCMRLAKAAPTRTLIRLAHRTFFIGAVAIVWATHRAVLARADYEPGSFLKACLDQYRFYLQPPRANSAAAPKVTPYRRPSASE